MLSSGSIVVHVPVNSRRVVASANFLTCEDRPTQGAARDVEALFSRRAQQRENTTTELHLTSMFFARALAVRRVQASRPLASKRMQQRSWARGIFFPPGPPAEGSKIGFTTYAMWGLCAVVVGVCYVLEQNEAPSKSSSLPVDVQRVLPSGAYLMSAR